MHALVKQLEFELQHFNVSKDSIETVFIGGGTPSTVQSELYEPLFKVINSYLQDDAEITSEANPNSATYEWLEGMYKLGVNRISFGVQSFDNPKLKALNRAHNADEAKNAVLNASKIGFNNLSLDIIYATAYDTKGLLQNDLNIAFSLPINHISAYALTIEEGTPFSKTPEVALEKLELTKWFLKELQHYKFHHYEISNFGTYQSQHNLGYWNYKDYIGLGAGAVGFLKNTRFYPTTSIEGYIENPLNISEEILTQEEIKTEKLFLGLRCDTGVEEKVLNLDERLRADVLVKESKLIKNGTKYRNKDFLLSDEIALYILS
jgi:oxygen-independent coproporphyrinogen-3 oxidase